MAWKIEHSKLGLAYWDTCEDRPNSHIGQPERIEEVGRLNMLLIGDIKLSTARSKRCCVL